MRIYEGSPRQDWEETLRAIGAFADQERLKEILFLELQDGFLLQGLGVPAGGHDSDHMGTIAKRTYELLDDQVGQLMDERAAHRGEDPANVPHADLDNYYEQAMRIIGSWVDLQHARDLFFFEQRLGSRSLGRKRLHPVILALCLRDPYLRFFEQDGSFVVRILGTGAGGTISHRLAEFTREEIVAMIDEAPHLRDSAPAARNTAQGEAST